MKILTEMAAYSKNIDAEFIIMLIPSRGEIYEQDLIKEGKKKNDFDLSKIDILKTF